MGRKIGVILLTVLAAISGVISVSVFFSSDEPFPKHANVLIASFGVGFAILAAGITLGPFRRGERWATLLLLVWPAFFLIHVLMLGTLLRMGSS